MVEELAARLGHTKVYKGKEDELRIGKRVLEIKHGLVYSACESHAAPHTSVFLTLSGADYGVHVCSAEKAEWKRS